MRPRETLGEYRGDDIRRGNLNECVIVPPSPSVIFLESPICFQDARRDVNDHSAEISFTSEGRRREINVTFLTLMGTRGFDAACVCALRIENSSNIALPISKGLVYKLYNMVVRLTLKHYFTLFQVSKN